MSLLLAIQTTGLSISAATFNVTASDIGLKADRVAFVDPISCAVTVSGDLYHDKVLAFNNASYTVTASDVSMLKNIPMSISSGEYAVTLGDWGNVWNKNIDLASSYSVTANDAGLSKYATVRRVRVKTKYWK